MPTGTSHSPSPNPTHDLSSASALLPELPLWLCGISTTLVIWTIGDMSLHFTPSAPYHYMLLNLTSKKLSTPYFLSKSSLPPWFLAMLPSPELPLQPPDPCPWLQPPRHSLCGSGYLSSRSLHSTCLSLPLVWELHVGKRCGESTFEPLGPSSDLGLSRYSVSVGWS